MGIVAAARVSPAEDNAKRVVRDVREAGVWSGSPIACYRVPPISPIKRLPDAIPPDGCLSDRLRVIAARGEFGPASFVVFPFEDVDGLTLAVSDLTGTVGTIPSAAVDIRVVKCWYQAGTAWHSYFADAHRRVLVPELLLHDDSLIKVDHETQDNYLRIDYPEGSKYVCVSYPPEQETGERFNYCTEPVADSAELQPVALAAGATKQFWITVHVPADAAAGIYESRIGLSHGDRHLGDMTLALRVLPFELPSPRTYYDLDRDFYTGIYSPCSMEQHLEKPGVDWATAEKRLLAEYRNMRDHSILHPLRRGYRPELAREWRRDLELMIEAGLCTRPVFGPVLAMPPNAEEITDEWMAEYRRNTDEAFAIFEEVFGHHDLFAQAWDEPGRALLLRERPLWEYIHDKGGRIYSTSKPWHVPWTGHCQDFTNNGGPARRDAVTTWHRVGARTVNYAAPHTGPENPDFMRRTHGMQVYKAGQDGTFNYICYQGPPNIWNDFGPGAFRSFCVVYPTRDGVIDTIAWEGIREGIDDVRYATKLKTLAQALIESGTTDDVYAARRALVWLEGCDAESADLNTMRAEMVGRILDLHARSGGGAS